MHAPCLDCDAACCGHYAIYVTHRDVQRLARATGQPPASFCALEPEIHSPHLPRANVGGHEVQLVLRAGAAGERCCFQDPASGLCGVHDHAPRICQLYPFEAVDSSFRSLRQRRDVMCPGPFPLQPRARRTLLRAARRFWLGELPAYRRRVQAWNRRRREPDDLGTFVAALTRRFPPLL